MSTSVRHAVFVWLKPASKVCRGKPADAVFWDDCCPYCLQQSFDGVAIDEDAHYVWSGEGMGSDAGRLMACVT